MSDLTKLDKLIGTRAEKLQELNSKLDELSTELDAAKGSNNAEAIRKVWQLIVDVSTRLSNYADMEIGLAREAEKFRTEQTHSITIRSKRRIVISKDCITEIWNAMEHEEGYSEVIVARKSGSVTTIRRLDELWKETNAGRDRIVILVIKLNVSTKKYRIEWTTDPESRSGTEISIFDRRDLAEQKASEVQSILHRYEFDSLFPSQLRPYIRMAIVLGVGLFALQGTREFLESVIENVGLYSFLSGVMGAGAIIGAVQLMNRIDKRVEIELGQGMRRVEWNRRFRGGAIVVLLSVGLTYLATLLF